MLNFQPRVYVTHQWALVALCALVVFLVALALPTPIGAPLALLAVIVYAQFMYAAVYGADPENEPFLIRCFSRLKRLWQWSEPLTVGYHGGQVVYIRNPTYESYREYYNAEGYYLGCDYFENRMITKPDWEPGDPDDITIEFRPYHGDTPKRLSWLARWRLPALPEVIDNDHRVHPFSAVLNSAYDGEVILLQMRIAA